MRWLHLRLQAPLASFGSELVDAAGVTRLFPTQSMVTGLCANALGWTRDMGDEHDGLQRRIVFGAMHDALDPGSRIFTDFQTAELRRNDKAWTTRGYPMVRAGGSYDGPDLRYREYHADLQMSVLMRLAHDDDPTIERLTKAFRSPARPLFIGRKPCLPSRPMFDGWVDGPDIISALRSLVPPDELREALWPRAEGVTSTALVVDITDERNWRSGLHGGLRHVCLDRLERTGQE